MVPMAASAKARKSGPHRLRHLGRETERRRRGVASCMLRSWRVLAPWLPPGGRIPIDPSTNAIAIAVTGGPKRRPIAVVFPRDWDTDAVVHRIAMLPQLSVDDIRGRDGRMDNDNCVLLLLVVLLAQALLLRPSLLGIILSSGCRCRILYDR